MLDSNGEDRKPPFYKMAFSVDDGDQRRVSFVDLLLVVVRNRRMVGIATGIGLLVGLYGLFFPGPPSYQSSATVVRETESGAKQGYSRIGMLGLGGLLGSSPTGLTAATYPELIQSREVRLGVVRDTFYISSLDSSLVLSDYLVQPKPLLARIRGQVHRYTFGLLTTVRDAMSSDGEAPSKARAAATSAASAPASAYPTFKEEAAINRVRNLINVSVEEKTGLMRLTATTPDARLSSDLIDRLLFHLQDRIREIETEKARQNLTFIQERFNEVGQELSAAEEELATFMDRNMSAASARLQVDRQRLQRKVDFKAQLYSQLQTDLVQAEMELQRRTPVVTLVEQPVPATGSIQNRAESTLFISILIGFMLGIGVAFARWLFERETQDEEEQEKLQQLRAHLPVDRWRAMQTLWRLRSREQPEVGPASPEEA